jgi:hypothetical protein
LGVALVRPVENDPCDLAVDRETDAGVGGEVGGQEVR